MHRYSSAVKVWLMVGVVMVFLQIVIGGITRLTGSGLSITKWEIVTGTLPPLSADAWDKEFDLYKETPQYQKINKGMTMPQFKVIYFWEYLHRVWARGMGFVFLIPFLIFWRRGMLDKTLMKRLGIVVLMAAVVASFGWIMVASGLIERPWVNAYKLTMHLSLALILFCYLLWVTLQVLNPERKHLPKLKKNLDWLLGLIFIQIMLGGLMSGMKAGLFFPTWPDMNGALLPGILTDAENWKLIHFTDYDKHPFMPALVQFVHRLMAYIVALLVLLFYIRQWRLKLPTHLHQANALLLLLVVIQVGLGIFTVLACRGTIPVGLGSLHQIAAILLLSNTLYLNYLYRPTR